MSKRFILGLAVAWFALLAASASVAGFCYRFGSEAADLRAVIQQPQARGFLGLDKAGKSAGVDAVTAALPTIQRALDLIEKNDLVCGSVPKPK